MSPQWSSRDASERGGYDVAAYKTAAQVVDSWTWTGEGRGVLEADTRDALKRDLAQAFGLWSDRLKVRGR